MAHLGGVFTSNGKFFAKIETREGGMRFHMEGPRREDKQQAAQDLTDIRAAASGKATRLDELHAMKLATKRLQENAKAAIRGGTPAVDSDCFAARIKYVEDSIQKSIAGPPRRTERRAKADLAKLRQAAQGQATIEEGFVAMDRKSRDLHQEAEFEARVAMGLAQHGFSRDAHKVVDSDPESEADAPPPAQNNEGGDWLYDADFSDPAVVKKLFPPPPPTETKAPPKDANDATQQLVKFMPNSGTPAQLRSILAGRADPNVNVDAGMTSHSPLLPELLGDLRKAGLNPNFRPGKGTMSPLRCVFSLARDEHLAEMRDLLIEYGAKYGPEEHEREQSRLDSNEHDPIYVRDFHKSATVPCTGPLVEATRSVHISSKNKDLS